MVEETVSQLMILLIAPLKLIPILFTFVSVHNYFLKCAEAALNYTLTLNNKP